MPDAAIIITTKDRKEDLRHALKSAVEQQGADVQVLVVDDGSTDGTAEMIRDEFPGVDIHREQSSRGYIVRRNQAATLAKAPIIFSIDDDATFSSPHVVARTLGEFSDKRIGAVAVPFCNVNQGPSILQKAPDTDAAYITNTYIGTAHALRRELFLKLGGYREVLFHQGEENDYCLRMLDAGYFVRLGSSDPVYHHESPRRDITRMSLFGRRNDVLYAWHNVPMPHLPFHLAGTTLNGLIHGLKTGHPLLMLRGLLQGYTACLSEPRKPVGTATYRLMRRLKKNGPIELQAL